MPEDLNKKLEECRKKRDEYLAGWQRARADFINYKKDEAERLKEFVKAAHLDFILKILPILDNFEAAEKGLKNRQDDKEIKGLLQIKTQLEDFLKKEGVEEIKTLGEKFDPNFHEAVEGRGDRIVEVVKKGYLLDNKVIRPAQVKLTE